MKRLISAALVIIFMLVSIKTYAFDWKSLDISVVDQTEEGSKTTLMLKDKRNRTFTVVYQEEEMVLKFTNQIVNYKNEFYAWRNIRCKDINFMVFANLLEVAVIPQEILHKQLNLANAIPSGIKMTYDPENDLMHYDFRIMKENQFIRITGDYTNGDELSAKLNYAYDHPSTYLQPAITDATQQENAALKDENEKLRQALIYLYNEDWNGRQKAIPPETIQRVVELKQKNPEMTKIQLWKALKKEKVKITKRELDLIFIIYFYELK